MITEEHVTRALATVLSREGWRIIAVHPPGGQGPFVIPRSPRENNIERASYHPDVAAIRTMNGRTTVLLAESKVAAEQLAADRLKLQELAANRLALLFALFRCQRFPHGATDTFDFESLATAATADLPVQFALACSGPADTVTPHAPIQGFPCTSYVFSEKTLLAP